MKKSFIYKVGAVVVAGGSLALAGLFAKKGMETAKKAV